MLTMRIYWRLMGSHVHLRVFVGGAMAGRLTMRDGEWSEIRPRLMRCGFDIQDDRDEAADVFAPTFHSAVDELRTIHLDDPRVDLDKRLLARAIVQIASTLTDVIDAQTALVETVDYVDRRVKALASADGGPRGRGSEP